MLVRRSRGHIATVLLISVVALTLLFTIAASALSHLRLTSHADNAQKAQNLAEAAVQTAIASLRQDLRFGITSGLLPDMPASLVKVETAYGQGRLSFHPGKAAELGLPLSCNNVASDTPKEGWKGRLVPSEAVQLIGVGLVGGVTRTVEMVLHVPRFPYVISSSGSFVCDGPLRLGVVPAHLDPTKLSGEELLPGHLVSNSRDPRAVQISGETVVSGDVEAVGGITMSAPAVVQGSVKPHSQEASLAKLRVGDYDPLGKYAGVESFLGSHQSETLAGYNRGTGDVVVSGDLNLEAGVLYVDGQLRVSGGVKGRGALIATGGIVLGGASTLESDHQVALLSQGDIELRGSGSFRGLIYTEGNLTSQGVKLLGSLITNSSSEQGGKVALRESGLLAGDPNMSFDEGWLCEEWCELEGSYTNPTLPANELPRVRQQAKFVGLEDGLIVVEWSYQFDSPRPESGFETPPPVVREYYNAEGERVRSGFEAVQEGMNPGNTTTGGGGRPFGYGNNHDLKLQVDGVTALTIRFQSPPLISPEKIRVFREVQDFKLDFSQFLRPEDRLRLLLRADH